MRYERETPWGQEPEPIEQLLLPFEGLELGSRWVNRNNGQIAVILDIRRSIRTWIKIRRDNRTTEMRLDEFRTHYAPFVQTGLLP